MAPSWNEWLAWLNGLTLNCLRNWERAYEGTKRRSVIREVQLGESLAGRADPVQDAMEREQQARFDIRFGQLPRFIQVVIELTYRDGMSAKAIGESLGCSTPHVYEIRRYAVPWLYEQVCEDHQGEEAVGRGMPSWMAAL